MLQTMLGLPMSDFAYIKNNVYSTKAKFKLLPDQENLLIKKYKQMDWWIYNVSLADFDSKFENFSRNECSSDKCAEKIQLLDSENEKLAELCGVERNPESNNFWFDLEKLRNKPELILRCFSFVILPDNKELLWHLNQQIQLGQLHQIEDEEIMNEVASKWWQKFNKDIVQRFHR